MEELTTEKNFRNFSQVMDTFSSTIVGACPVAPHPTKTGLASKYVFDWPSHIMAGSFTFMVLCKESP